MSVRYFLFEQDDTLKHVPLRVVEGLVVGNDRLPQYASQHVRIAVVYLCTDNRRPVSVYRVDGSIWHFDAAG